MFSDWNHRKYNINELSKLFEKFSKNIKFVFRRSKHKSRNKGNTHTLIVCLFDVTMDTGTFLLPLGIQTLLVGLFSEGKASDAYELPDAISSNFLVLFAGTRETAPAGPVPQLPEAPSLQLLLLRESLRQTQPAGKAQPHTHRYQGRVKYPY